MTLDPDQKRRLDNKRFNERVKLAYTTINAFAIGIVGAAFIVPGVSGAASMAEIQRSIWLLAAAALHLLSYVIVQLLRSEE